MKRRGIYMFEGGGYQKIGMTSDIDERLRVLRLSVPFDVELVVFKEVSLQKYLRDMEMSVHSKFNAHRVRPRSEWFKLTEEARQACIETINNLQVPKYGGRRKDAPFRVGKGKDLQTWAAESLERLRNFSVA